MSNSYAGCCRSEHRHSEECDLRCAGGDCFTTVGPALYILFCHSECASTGRSPCRATNGFRPTPARLSLLPACRRHVECDESTAPTGVLTRPAPHTQLA